MSYSYTDINSSVDMSLNNMEYYEYFFIDANSGNINITLPSSYDGAFFQFHRIDTSSNDVTFYPASGDTINGTSSLLFPINRLSQVIKKNTDWILPRISFN
jgi:hypothetical protein